MRVDQEIACDAAVVAARPHDRRLYAELLLGAALTPFSAPFGCHWPATGVHPLKERLMMLNVVSTTPLRRKIGMVLVCAVGLAGAGAVWAANPAPRHVITKPNWSSRPTGEDMARFYPVDAAKAKIEGKATIDCRVAVDGRLNSCTVRFRKPRASRLWRGVAAADSIFPDDAGHAGRQADSRRSGHDPDQLPGRPQIGRPTPPRDLQGAPSGRLFSF
jgi:hypothetical protein